MRKPRLLLVSQAFPPEVSGSATLLTNLIESYKGECFAISGYSRYVKHDERLRPPCPTIRILPPKGKLFELGYAKVINKFRFIVRRVIRKQVKNYRPDAIMGVFPHSTFFIAAFEVAQELNIPFFAYMHDLWQENYPEKYYARILADKFEETILTKATRVICMTSTQQLHYKQKYGIDSDLLPHSIPPEKLKTTLRQPSSAHLHKKTILFAGAISSVMNQDALREISNNLGLLPFDYQFLFCSNAKKENLEADGYNTKNMNLQWVSKEELETLLSSADILLAPLSFKNCSSDEVRTVFSTKLLEYLVSGKPILVYGPPDCFHVTSAKEKGWAFVTDTENPNMLIDTIKLILENKTERDRVVMNAFKEAENRSAEIVAADLYELILKHRKKS